MNKKKVSEIEAPSLDNDLEYSLHLPRSLNIDEKKYLLAVERGDLANVRRMLQLTHKIQNVIIFLIIILISFFFSHLLKLNYLIEKIDGHKLR